MGIYNKPLLFFIKSNKKIKGFFSNNIFQAKQDAQISLNKKNQALEALPSGEWGKANNTFTCLLANSLCEDNSVPAILTRRVAPYTSPGKRLDP